MRALDERSDIIKRIHRGLAEQRIERSMSEFAVDEGDPTRTNVGRLVARGLDDELKGTAYAVIDGVDGLRAQRGRPDGDRSYRRDQRCPVARHGETLRRCSQA